MENRSKDYCKYLIRYLFLLPFILSTSIKSGAQTLDVSGNDNVIGVDNCCNGLNTELSAGNSQTYTLPVSVSFNAVTFDLRGGDGGSAKAGSNCKSEGGDGAISRITCLVGDGPNMLKPGSKIRFIVGKHGEETFVGPTAGGGGGGGGGTAVLYQPNTGDDWIILAVAGGGGGAYQGNLFGGCVDSNSGTGGRKEPSGSNGGGGDGGSGGTQGSAGGTGDSGAFLDAGPGGGHSGGGSNINGSHGFSGYPDGGQGGNPSYGNDGNFGIGGFGFGGGGSGGGSSPGGGGGGYSGGGSGEAQENGGGGGSYTNFTYSYLYYIEAGGNESGTDHGRVFYQFKNICEPEIADIEEINGFCSNSNGTAELKVNLTIPGNCAGLYYRLSGPNTLLQNETGLFTIHTSGHYNARLYYVVDGTINQVDTKSTYIYLNDMVPPVAKCKSSHTLNLTGGLIIDLDFAEELDNGSYDNCGVTSKTASKTSFGCGDVGSQNITLTVADAAGNTSTCETTVTVKDTGSPVPTLANLPTITNACSASVTAPTATDYCDGAFTGITNNPTDFDTPGTYTINWTYTDTKGNTTTQQQTVVVTDNSPPAAVCPNDITVEVEPANCSTAVDYFASATDNCESPVNAVSYTGNSSTVPAGTDRLLLVQMRGNLTPTGVTSVTYNGEPMTLAIRETGSNASLEIWYLLLGTGEEVSSSAQIVGLGGWSSVQYITFQHVDQNNPFGDSDTESNTNEHLKVAARTKDIIYEGASRNSSQTVDPLSGQTEIFDHRPGFFPARNWGAYMPGADDIKSLSINYADHALRAVIAIRAAHTTSYSFDINPGSTFQVGTTPVTFTATDQGNNTNSCVFNVIVKDKVDPTISCPSNITLNANQDNAGGCTASTTFSVTTSDDCSTPVLTQTAGLASGADFPIGTTTNTFVSTDAGGRTATCTFTISVNDIQAPTALCKNKTVQLDANGNATISTTDINNGSSDNCGNIASLSLDVTSFDCEDVGTHTVALTVKDDYDNTNTCQATVTVEDNIAPTALCKNKTLQLDANGEGTITTPDIDNNSSDICGIASLSLDNTSFDCEDIGAHTITLTVKDNNDNTSTCQASLTVEDKVTPIALCKNKTLQLDANGEGSITTNDINNNSTDACGIASLSLDNTSFDCEDVGTHAITLTVKDNNDNTSTCQASLTVEDKVAPIALCQNHTIQLDADGNGSISTEDIDNNSNDACGIASLSLDYTNFNCDQVGSNTVTLNVTDNNGNNSSCQAIVTVEDNIAPIALCHDITVELDANGEATITPEDIDGEWNSDYLHKSYDNCDISLSIDVNTFDCTDVGNDNTLTLTVTDDSGNASTCTSTITVEDNISPVITCQDATLILIPDQHKTSVNVSDLYTDITDNCIATSSVTFSPYEVDCSNVGVPTTITITAHIRTFSGEMQTGSCTSTLTVLDNDAPITVCHDITIELDANGQASITPADVDGEVSGNSVYPSVDLCDFSTSIDISSFDCSDIGINQVTLTATDVSGNSDQCVSNVTVMENSSLPGGWQATDIGQVTIGNEYWYDPCEYPPLYYVTGSGNNATNMMADNVAFTSYNICGDATLTTKIESVDPNGYGGLMIRETTDADSKQVALFSNLSNSLRHETRYLTGANKVVQNFVKPSPVWLRLQRQGDWIFSYYSYDGNNFQYVHGVYLPLQACLEIGLASFTYMPNAQTEAVFSNVSISSSNGGFADNNGDAPIFDTYTPTPGTYQSPTDNRSLLTVNLFPNPNKGQFTLEFEEPLTHDTYLKIFNSYGQLIHQQLIATGMKFEKCDLKQVPADKYMLHLQSEELDTPTTKTIVITH